MTKDWSRGEILKAVFPLLDGTDLASCMLVCRQWRDIASDDYFWKCMCAKRWPSICKRPPPTLTYSKLFAKFFKPARSLPSPPKLCLNDLDFYIDIWLEEKNILSEALSGSVLRTGIKNPPPGIPDNLRAHLDNTDYKMVMHVEPRFSMPQGQTVSVSVLVSRRDTNKIACIMNQAVFDYVDGSTFRALAYNYLRFSPDHPFLSGIRGWVSLLFTSNSNENIKDVFGIEIDFCDAATSEYEVLRLLDILDWK